MPIKVAKMYRVPQASAPLVVNLQVHPVVLSLGDHSSVRNWTKATPVPPQTKLVSCLRFCIRVKFFGSSGAKYAQYSEPCVELFCLSLHTLTSHLAEPLLPESVATCQDILGSASQVSGHVLKCAVHSVDMLSQ